MTKRLPWLLAALAALVVFRVWAPPGTASVPVLAEPLLRHAPRSRAPGDAVPRAMAPTSESVPQDQGDDDVVGDAFAIRPPPPAPYTPPAASVASARPKPTAAPITVAAPVVADAPLPLPVPYQVIGTWDDGTGLGVFLAGPQGTLLAREGVTLQGEYKVSAVTAQQVVLLQLSSRREVRLSVPIVAPTFQQPLSTP